jgi:hypothetical protein
MPYIVYKVIHYLGIFLLVVVLGASMGRRVAAEGPDPLKKRFATLHGLALFLVLLGGFGLLARINVEHGTLFPGWVWVKLAIWVLLGGIVVVARKRSGWAMPLILLVPVLAMLAGYVAYAKPF